METQYSTAELDELDRQLVHALQIHPRAPWRLVGEVLGVDPVTVARRWRRLESRGLAWVTAYPRLSDARNAVTAVVEIETEAGAARQVAAGLASEPWIVTIKHTTGARDLVVTVQAPDLDSLTGRLSRSMSTVPGVRATRTHLATLIPTEGSRWRLRSLDREQRVRMEQAAPDVRPRPADPWQEVDARLVALLSTDGRMSAADLAAGAGTSVTTVRRRLDALIGSRVNLRCDLARPMSGWPVSAVYFASVPAERAQETTEALARVAEIRSCGIFAGPHNLIIDAWLRELSEVYTLEAHLSGRITRLVVHDRCVVLNTSKHMGRVLGGDGRCVGTVPMDLWSATSASS
ncbi:AsnC family transcriptional regulator [Actinoallomurus purpureus]|uniref:Lrp/AsnC family transcriptional regulator n=1 Tax=Actinoallomurus purpureus TaxID=478114 RepID=UPI0020937F01|nr:AsnC family transcriptional regulator [Actinoallomurus purpureus]MCO6005232.1 AsnC family transcriptional regulator [Actinoallomurus purpureus]